MTVTTVTLKLVSERKIGALMPRNQASARWEASGVLAKDRYFFVVFDDRSEIARIADDLEANNANGLFGKGHIDGGYEGNHLQRDKQRFDLPVESRKHAERWRLSPSSSSTTTNLSSSRERVSISLLRAAAGF